MLLSSFEIFLRIWLLIRSASLLIGDGDFFGFLGK